MSFFSPLFFFRFFISYNNSFLLKVYKERASKEMEAYKVDLAEWKRNFPKHAQMLNDEKKRKRQDKAEKKKKRLKRQKKDPNAPKRAMSAFMFYSQEHRAQVQEQNPDVTFGQIGRILGTYHILCFLSLSFLSFDFIFSVFFMLVELTSSPGDHWKKLPEPDREKYQKRAEEDRERYLFLSSPFRLFSHSFAHKVLS